MYIQSGSFHFNYLIILFFWQRHLTIKDNNICPDNVVNIFPQNEIMQCGPTGHIMISDLIMGS